MLVEGILDKIIKPEFRTKFKDWEQYAKPIDLFGLNAINDIFNNKGTKKLKVKQLVVQAPEMSATKSSFLGETQTSL